MGNLVLNAWYFNNTGISNKKWWQTRQGKSIYPHMQKPFRFGKAQPCFFIRGIRGNWSKTWYIFCKPDSISQIALIPQRSLKLLNAKNGSKRSSFWFQTNYFLTGLWKEFVSLLFFKLTHFLLHILEHSLKKKIISVYYSSCMKSRSNGVYYNT